MDERLRLVARLLEGEKMAPLCAEFGISRKTGYKIFDRYKDCGVQAFSDRSRRPSRRHRGSRRVASPLRPSGRVRRRRDACHDAGRARRELCLLRRCTFEIRSGARRKWPLPIDPSHR